MSLFSSSLPQLSIWTLIDLSSEGGRGCLVLVFTQISSLKSPTEVLSLFVLWF